jgi:hypothetical protein
MRRTEDTWLERWIRTTADAQVDHLNTVLEEVAGRFQLRCTPLPSGDLDHV